MVMLPPPDFSEMVCIVPLTISKRSIAKIDTLPPSAMPVADEEMSDFSMICID
jgi:hypothetical protein